MRFNTLLLCVAALTVFLPSAAPAPHIAVIGSGGGIRAAAGFSLALSELFRATYPGGMGVPAKPFAPQISRIKGISGSTWGMHMFLSSYTYVKTAAVAPVAIPAYAGASPEGLFIIHQMNDFYQRLGAGPVKYWGPNASMRKGSAEYYYVWRDHIGRYIVDPFRVAPGYQQLQHLPHPPVDMHFNYVQHMFAKTGLTRYAFNRDRTGSEYYCEVIVTAGGALQRQCTHAKTLAALATGTAHVYEATLPAVPVIELLSVCSSAAAFFGKYEPSNVGSHVGNGAAQAQRVADVIDGAPNAPGNGADYTVQTFSNKLYDSGIKNNLPYLPEQADQKVLAFEYSFGSAVVGNPVSDPFSNFFKFLVKTQANRAAHHFYFKSWTLGAVAATADAATRLAQNHVVLYSIQVTDGALPAANCLTTYYIYPFRGINAGGHPENLLIRDFPTAAKGGAKQWKRPRFISFLDRYYVELIANIGRVADVVMNQDCAALRAGATHLTMAQLTNNHNHFVSPPGIGERARDGVLAGLIAYGEMAPLMGGLAPIYHFRQQFRQQAKAGKMCPCEPDVPDYDFYEHMTYIDGLKQLSNETERKIMETEVTKLKTEVTGRLAEKKLTEEGEMEKALWLSLMDSVIEKKGDISKQTDVIYDDFLPFFDEKSSISPKEDDTLDPPEQYETPEEYNDIRPTAPGAIERRPSVEAVANNGGGELRPQGDARVF